VLPAAGEEINKFVIIIYTNLDKMAGAGKQTFGRVSSRWTRNDFLQPLETPAQLRPSAYTDHHMQSIT